MNKRWIVAIIAAILFAIIGVSTVSAGYGSCSNCSCGSFYSKTAGTTCSKCGHSFYDHKR